MPLITASHFATLADSLSESPATTGNQFATQNYSLSESPVTMGSPTVSVVPANFVTLIQSASESFTTLKGPVILTSAACSVTPIQFVSGNPTYTSTESPIISAFPIPFISEYLTTTGSPAFPIILATVTGSLDSLLNSVRSCHFSSFSINVCYNKSYNSYYHSRICQSS